MNCFDILWSGLLAHRSQIDRQSIDGEALQLRTLGYAESESARERLRRRNLRKRLGGVVALTRIIQHHRLRQRRAGFEIGGNFEVDLDGRKLIRVARPDD